MATQEQIDKLRSYDGFDGYDDADEAEEIEGLLIYELDAREVNETFTEGSRWSNYKTTVYRVVTEPYGGELFFAVTREVPATEMQDGGDFSYEFNEVYKTERTVIVYE